MNKKLLTICALMMILSTSSFAAKKHKKKTKHTTRQARSLQKGKKSEVVRKKISKKSGEFPLED